MRNVPRPLFLKDIISHPHLQESFKPALVKFRVAFSCYVLETDFAFQRDELREIKMVDRSEGE